MKHKKIYQFKIFSLVFLMNARSLWSYKSRWISLFLFALTLLLLFPFVFGSDILRQFEVQIGSYWMIQEFLAALLITNMFKLEQAGNVFDVYDSVKNIKQVFFWGKVFFTTVYLISLQLPILFFWGIIFNLDAETIVLLYPKLFLLSLFFSFTASLLGAFLYFVTRTNLMKEVLQPLLFFPLQSATLLASVGVCLDTYHTSTNSAWWNIIVLYPMALIGISLIFGEMIYE